MPHTTLQPELVERRRLIAALHPATLQALSTHGDIDDRAMARAEIRLREANLFASGDPADGLRETVRVCRHCGIGAPEAVAMSEPWCPGRGFHSYVDTPVSRPLPDLLETGWGR